MRSPRHYLLFLLICLSGCALPKVAVHEGYSLKRNITYTPERWPEAVLGDFYRPRVKRLVPAVLLIHGGAWTGKDGRWQMEPIAKRLACRGYAVLNVTYRLAPQWRYPAPAHDVQEAVKWLRDHAVEEGIDPLRIAIYGYSAGGYLATHVGLIEGPESAHVRAIVAGSAPSDLRFYPGGDLVPQFLGGTQREIPERFKEASPVTYVTRRSPPMFIYHSTGDQLVPPEHAWAMMAAYEKNRVPYESYWIDGRGHVGAFLLPSESVSAAIDFLDRQLSP